MLTRNRPSWYKPDNGLAARMVLTMFLLGAVYVGFVFALQYAFNIGFIPLLLIAVAIAAIQFFFSDKIALASMKARIRRSEQEAPELHDMIGRLAAQANLPKPTIAIVDTAISQCLRHRARRKNTPSSPSRRASMRRTIAAGARGRARARADAHHQPRHAGDDHRDLLLDDRLADRAEHVLDRRMFGGLAAGGAVANNDNGGRII